MTIMSEIKDQGACKRSALTVSDRVGIMKDMRNSIVSKGVLYDSVARGTNTAESDVDVAMLVHGALDRDTEDKLSDFIVDMNIKYNRVFSVIDIDAERFFQWEAVTPFYQNVNKEGIVLWRAA